MIKEMKMTCILSFTNISKYIMMDLLIYEY